MKTNKINVKVLAEIAIFAALAIALDYIQGGYSKGLFLNGGSIGIAMIPIFIISFRRGIIPGVICGLIVSLIQMLGGLYIMNTSYFNDWRSSVAGPFIQVFLDYVLAYTLVGLSGAFSGLYHKSETKGQKILWIVVGCSLGALAKYAMHVLSGGFFYLNYGNSFMGVSDTSWLYSFIYNGAYCIPNWIVCSIIVAFIAVVYPQILNANYSSKEEVSEEVSYEQEQN